MPLRLDFMGREGKKSHFLYPAWMQAGTRPQVAQRETGFSMSIDRTGEMSTELGGHWAIKEQLSEDFLKITV